MMHPSRVCRGIVQYWGVADGDARLAPTGMRSYSRAAHRRVLSCSRRVLSMSGSPFELKEKATICQTFLS